MCEHLRRPSSIQYGVSAHHHLPDDTPQRRCIQVLWCHAAGRPTRGMLPGSDTLLHGVRRLQEERAKGNHEVSSSLLEAASCRNSQHKFDPPPLQFAFDACLTAMGVRVKFFSVPFRFWSRFRLSKFRQFSKGFIQHYQKHLCRNFGILVKSAQTVALFCARNTQHVCRAAPSGRRLKYAYRPRENVVV